MFLNLYDTDRPALTVVRARIKKCQMRRAPGTIGVADCGQEALHLCRSRLEGYGGRGTVSRRRTTTSLLGETYRSSEQALKELVDNAWDAEATEVRITLPAAVSGAAIVVADNGSGMTQRELREEYLFVANDRSTRRGNRTPFRNRLVKGRRGIGKFAGLLVAATMCIETSARGVHSRIVINREDLRQPQRDLEKIPLQMETQGCRGDEHGTTITLSQLNQHLEFPRADRLKGLLMLEYGRHPEFALFVNDEAVDLADIPGDTFEYPNELPDAGQVRLRFTLAEGRKPLKESGIMIRVGGKSIGRPTYFGLDADPEIPQKVLKKIYGEVDADALLNDVTADWGAIIENSKAYQVLSSWTAARLKESIVKEFAREVSLAKARHQLEINRALEQLPEYRRPIAQRRIERMLNKLYGTAELTEERIAAVVAVSLDALEYDDYWVVIEAIDAAKDQDVNTFAVAIGTFGLVDMAVMAVQARRRLDVIDRLDHLIAKSETIERDMHEVIEHNLWLLGPDYALLASNKTLARIVDEYTGAAFRGTRAAKRPDLLLCADVRQRHVLIELKRPSHDITRDDEAQAVKYRDELRRTFDNIELLVIGKGFAPAVDPGALAPKLQIMSYAALVSTARTQLQWLLTQLSDARR